MKIELNSLKDTEKLGEKLGSLLKKGDILCLNGDLGAGKTTLTKSLGVGLGVEEYITSPTFSLINEYRGRMPVYHFDVYRLEGIDELDDLGFDEYFFGEGVCIIEWAEKIEKMLPKDIIILNIEKGQDIDKRIVYITGSSDRYKEILRELGVE
ncbi:tRNA (adenosine(37)-N6)-threonylcarbamoyltransferase complex ATPase subunit type 1 TsaE [Tissierella creatinophila]|uniref:tRNA threonylcarbamoyladenosine biosynthesis protein TsaE n=1 Tax=Tissierella creatinophila DSM 6911 TaxID=1123403 RepID=A0A1U7M823_TISCR|nr:tRNA (adenosine(37)-N6)-threonylcarbamoyltransferase complex ATPase subunit type 1 TsaE [Tissierella creatinophila]OLS03484.1 tRNA threonylcarbamoyladenosine biosynthesis protein TsaE [Tissierella creatinophila DSM 6911]